MDDIYYDRNYRNINYDRNSQEKKLTVNNGISDFFSIKSAYQTLLIQKTLECHDMMTDYFKLSHPIARMMFMYVFFNPSKTYDLLKNNIMKGFNSSFYLKNSLLAFLTFRKQPIKKTYEITYINENLINHLYFAFDWYLKTNSKIKTVDNHTILIVNKPIEGSKVDKEYNILKTIPDEIRTEFEYKSCKYYYSKTSYEDTIYAPSGEIKKRNYKITIWTYDEQINSFDNLTSYIVNQYAKSKIDDVWTQKLFTHENNCWIEKNLDKNKRKISSVIMKNDKNIEISNMLQHFSQSEEWHLERGLPYKKSFLFYGPPGTGKSSMIKAISYELQRHIHYLNLSTINNDQELMNIMSKIDYKETIIVIEDIDAQSSIVYKRNSNDNNKINDNINEKDININNTLLALNLLKDSNMVDKEKTKSKLTLSGLLNQIDGVHNNHGMILIMTTNCPEKLDDALIRDGRVDERILFDYVDHEQIYKMFKNFYDNNIVSLDLIKSKINTNIYKTTHSSVENSMRRHYNNQINALDDIINSFDKKF